MSEPTSGGWASPADRSGPRPDADLPGSPPEPPAAWQGQSGWGGAGAPAPSAWTQGQPLAPRPGVVPLRPLGLGELLDGAVGLVRGYPRPALTVSALVALVSTAVQLLLLLTLLQPLFDVDTTSLASGDSDELVSLLAGTAGAGLVSLVVGTVAGALMTGFLTRIAGKAVLGQPLTTRELWAATRPQVGRLVGSALLFGLVVYGTPVVGVVLAALLAGLLGVGGAIAGGLLALASVVFAGIAYVRFSLATSALVLEDAPVVLAFRRSWRLVRRSSWRVLGVLLLTIVIAGFVGQVVQLPFTLFAGDGGPFAALSGDAQSISTTTLVLTTIGGGVAATLVAPFTAGVTALLYVDRRMRAEGLDVALQAAART